MRKVGDLFKELGFKEESSDDVKKAFLKNLQKAAKEAGRAEIKNFAGYDRPQKNKNKIKSGSVDENPPLVLKPTEKIGKKRKNEDVAAQLEFDFVNSEVKKLA